MGLFDGLNSACVDVFSDGDTITYTHMYFNAAHQRSDVYSQQPLKAVFVDHVSEPVSPGPITQLSCVSADLSPLPSKKDLVTRPNGDVYVVTEITADNGGMTHLELRKQ